MKNKLANTLKLGLIATIIAFIAGISFGGIHAVKAISLYYQSDSLNLASTTAAYIIGGTGTTTKPSISDGFGRISYLVSLASSTTPPTLCWRNEYSSNGTDWYAENVNLNELATSTVGVRTFKEECWLYATTTDETLYLSKGSDGNTIYIGKKIDVPSLSTAWTRTKFYLNAGVNGRLDIKKVISNEVTQTK